MEHTEANEEIFISSAFLGQKYLQVNYDYNSTRSFASFC